MKTGWRVAEGWKDSIEVIKTNQGPDLSSSQVYLILFFASSVKSRDLKKSIFPSKQVSCLNYFNILNKQAIRKENLLEWVVCR